MSTVVSDKRVPPAPGKSSTATTGHRPRTWRGVRTREQGGRAGSVREFVPPGQVNSKTVYARGGYRATQISVLLTRYVRIRGDVILSAFRLGTDDAAIEHAILCAEHLDAARTELERRIPKLAVCANLLALADRELVSLYAPEILEYRIDSVRDNLQRMKPAPEGLIKRLERISRDKSETDDHDELCRAALKDGLTYIHGADERALIEDDLQVGRLKSVIVFVLAAWALLIAGISLVTTTQVADGGERFWPIWQSGTQWVDLTAGAVGLSIAGAVGGAISGMFRVRDSRADLSEYRTSMLKLYLRPLVGAVAAVTLYLFLSANVVSGVEVTNAGVYVVAAFMAGFSERYFLRVLREQDGVVGGAPTLPSAQVSAVDGVAPT